MPHTPVRGRAVVGGCRAHAISGLPSFALRRALTVASQCPIWWRRGRPPLSFPSSASRQFCPLSFSLQDLFCQATRPSHQSQQKPISPSINHDSAQREGELWGGPKPPRASQFFDQSRGRAWGRREEPNGPQHHEGQPLYSTSNCRVVPSHALGEGELRGRRAAVGRQTAAA